MSDSDVIQGVRLDKWLWACRFYKTRSLAKQGIDGGKVKINGVKAKPSREIKVGDEIKLRQGWDDKIVKVMKLSDQRRGAPEAQELYEETLDSINAREKNAAERKAVRGSMLISDIRPNKKQRRQIHRFKRVQNDTENDIE